MEIWVMLVITDPPVIDKAEHVLAIAEGRFAKRWLKDFWPDRRGGLGDVVLTDNPNNARKFESFEAVMDCWKTQSRVLPLRPDGKPNRPLTAYTIQPVRISPEP